MHGFFYRGVILTESLRFRKVLCLVEVLKTEEKEEPVVTYEQPKLWTWNHVEIPSEEIDFIINVLSMALKPRGWYINLWKERDFILIFQQRIFRGSKLDDPVWDEAIEYGLSVGVPLEQMTPLEKILYTV